MKNIFYIVFFATLLTACSSKVSKEDLKQLSGDWEIVQAEMPDGKIVEYDINMTVDYIEIDSTTLSKGIRKKFMPQFDGSRLNNGIEEHFVVIDSAGSYYLNYKTDYAKWTEQILSISSTEFIVKSENDIVYRYKKFYPIIVEKE